MPNQKMVLHKLAGSYQFIPETLRDITLIEKLDPAHWGAINVPRATLNGDQKLFEYLDSDNDQVIKPDDLNTAVKWLDNAIDLPSDCSSLEHLKISSIKRDSPIGADLYKNAEELLQINDHEITEINLDSIRKKQQQLTSGAMKGDGIIVIDAINNDAAAELAKDVISSLDGKKNSSGQTGVTSSMLDKFLADAAGFIAWERQKEDSSILPRGENTASAYEIFSAIRSKIDEFFAYCQLLQVDPCHEKRFEITPDNLPALDITDQTAIKDTIATAPLATPSPKAILHLNQQINPAYTQQVKRFITVSKSSTLSLDDWIAIKNEFAPYEAYLNSKAGTSVESLGSKKLNDYLNDKNRLSFLQELFNQDDKLMNKLNRLNELEKLMLFCKYIVEFINNFVSFKELFSPKSKSMIEAGHMIMDGYHFELAVKVNDIKKHKKIAKRSNLCVLYVKLNTPGKTSNVAIAATSGTIHNIYIGKPGLFFMADGREIEAEIIDTLAAPVSLKEALALPFNKLGEFLEQKIEKITTSKFKSVESGLDKQMNSIEKASLPGKSNTKHPISPMLLMGGGVGLAAIGSGFAFMVKSLKEVSWMKIALAIFIIILILAMPLIISAVIKLRRRNLGLFLEAAGWAVNLPLRLNRNMATLFTHTPPFPQQATHKRREMIKIFLKRSTQNKKLSPWVSWIIFVLALIYTLTITGLTFFPQLSVKIFDLFTF